MDQTKSLHTLLEVADLLAMVEDLSDPERVQRLSAASWAGMRITLRNSRERLLESHSDLSRGVVSSARSSESSQSKGSEQTRILTAQDEARASSQQAANAASQRDLKSELERFVERR